MNRKAVYEVTATDGNCQIFGLKCQRTLLENKSNQKLETKWERVKEVMELRRGEIMKEGEWCKKMEGRQSKTQDG